MKNECETGYISDYSNGYCYKILPTLESYNDGKKKCEYDNDAELVLFNTNSEVTGLIDIILRGIKIIIILVI